MATELVSGMLKPSPARERITFLCPEFEGDVGGIAEVEQAFVAQYACKEIYKKLKKAQRSGELPAKVPNLVLFAKALERGTINSEEHQTLLHADKLRLAAINVNDFEAL